MAKVILYHTNKEYHVNQKDLETWRKKGIRFKLLEADKIEKPAILKRKEIQEPKEEQELQE